jgi:hypothetical protein
MAIATPGSYCWSHQQNRNESTKRMTGGQSRLLKAGARVCWRNDKSDQGTVTDTDRSRVTLEWDSRGEQSILHNDMDAVVLVPRK